MPAATPLWTPSDDRAAASQMSVFLYDMAAKYRFRPTWDHLREWSILDVGSFWSEIIALAEISPSHPADTAVTGDGMLSARWFPGMRLNYARHMLRFDNETPALLYEGEDGATASLSHRALRRAVAACAAALRAAGVERGDRVAGYMPNVPETVVAMLATASLGAIWSSCSPDFGVPAVIDRFGQIEPKVLFMPGGYSYGGKRFAVAAERGPAILERLPSVRAVVVVGPEAPADLGGPGRSVATYEEFVHLRRHEPALTFEEVPFDHPLFIMYSSGTTGVPKCIVHGHGGTLLQHMKELMLHCDLRAGERIFYFTTCGWMMWNWLVSGLGVGATVVLFDGNPAHPTIDRLWEMAARLEVNVFGTSPKFLAGCQKAALQPGRQHNLAALRAVLSTGSPLSADLFEWVYRNVKAELQLSSISGGTDIISCFMLGNPILPVYAGEIQCRGLGMDVHAWDEHGRPVIGEKGELICRRPFPSQPTGFWNDPDGRKYRAAYFDYRFGDGQREVWRHGDFIEITETGGVIVHGRSDATLNPGGVRIGTAEIYRLVEGVPEVLDSLVVGRDTADQDVEVLLFVVLRPDVQLTTDLARRIRAEIAAGASKRHVPKTIRQVSAIPVTISGKKVELAVRQILMGEEVRNRDALANPHVLDEYREILRRDGA